MKSYNELAKEWSSDNHDNLKDYTSGSHHKALWKCANGHVWKAEIKSRYRGCGCPYCSGRYAISGENDLLTVNPLLARQWHSELNADLTPSMVKPWSNIEVWWTCEKGHVWKASPARRSGGKGCPYCASKKVLISDSGTGLSGNSLVKTFPKLIKEWDYSNNPEPPEAYTPYSNKKVKWRCAFGHSWTATISSRTRNDRPGGCPFCAGKKVLAGFNDLASCFPDIAREWDYEKNRITPDAVTPYSHKKVYWRCPVGHSYKTTICNRTIGKGCCICAKRKI